MISGDGADTLYGDGGTDTFEFLYASAFNNVDVVKDFNISTNNDRIDLSDVLGGTAYNHGVDPITDWVEFTTSGIVKVDRDGTGGTYSLTQIATLEGITGLTDEAALQASGNLVVA